MDTTWIKLHRKITKHWIFKDAEKFKAWVTILIEVNHAPNKVLISSTLFNVGRGESIKSISTWATLFGWDDSKVRRFFKLLKTDEMIDVKSESITTRLTVLNYNGYQKSRRADDEQMTSKPTSKRRGGDDKQEGKEGKEGKEKENIKERFEIFRKKYPGKKRGLDTEFENFKKKHKKHSELVDLLLPAIEDQIKIYDNKKKLKIFCPPYKNLATWINKKCWEDEEDVIITPTKKSNPFGDKK